MDPTWWTFIERFGLPTVGLVVIGYFTVKAVQAVWVFFKPMIKRVFDAAVDMIERQSRFIEALGTHQNEQVTLHETTHTKLDEHGRKLDTIAQRLGGK